MEISLQPLEKCDLLIIKGRIDSYTSPDLSEKLCELAASNRYRIILDLENVIFVSSAGLRVFIDSQKKCKNSNLGEVVLVHVPQRVYDTLDVSGFTSLFKIYDSVNSALEAF